MDPDLYREDVVIKTRKQYTITRQRERWTEEEHTKFLEALKLYGRAWQRIEEHIGTKTAVQIRSHAQKFFTKLEKEATVKGVGNTHDIEIPPPRPKRKPTNPYPRKTCIAPVFQLELKDGNVSDASSNLLQENDPEILYDHGNIQNSRKCHENDSCFDGPCASPASTDNYSFSSKAPMTSRACRQYIQVMDDDSSNQDESAAVSLVTADTVGNHAEHSDEKQLFPENALNGSLIMSAWPSCEEPHCEMVPEPKQSGNCCQTSIIDEQSSQNYPRHVPVYILAGSLGTSAQHFSADMQSMLNHGAQSLCINQAASATSEYHSNAATPSISQPIFSCDHLFTSIQNSDDYQAFLQMQSTFMRLILCYLSQNAAVYAAARFAATLLPWFNMGAPVEPSANLCGLSLSPPTSSTSNLEAIAAATLAAASAWWTANGLLPSCHHPGFMFSTASATAAQAACCQSGNVDGEATETTHDPALENQPDVEFSEAQNSKSRTSPSDSEAGEAEKAKGELTAAGSAEAENEDAIHDSYKSKNNKQLGRSSCGSNTTSGSEVETDTNKLGKGREEKYLSTNEDNNVLDAAPPIADLFSRRSRTNNSVADSWKEVSEEGRLAFQALFSREVLPQSFSPSHDISGDVKKQSSNHEEGNKLMLNHDGSTSTSTTSGKLEIRRSSTITGNKREGLFNEELGQNKLKTFRTGFKPYKRCSEAKEAIIPSNHQEEEKDPKKLCLEREVNGGSAS